jgi:dihydrofolate synthase/folylpolyglutamate synthase
MDWINKLMDLPKYGAGIGLHRIDYLCRDIQASAWWKNLDSIHVVGTNGKGSTTVMVSAILEQLGFVTGQYTSPHLIDFSERIQVAGEPIERPDLIRLIQSFFDQKKQYEASFPGDIIGAFEAFTSIGLHYFYEKKPDVLVVEAGIGGRFDPTRICSGRFIGLTSVDLEHTQLLGNTLEEIALDKIDIARSGSTVIVGEVPVEVERKLRAYARIKGVELLTVGQQNSIHQIRYEGNRMKADFSLDGLEFKSLLCPLIGPHQLNNLMLAILLVKKWLVYKQLGVEDKQLIRATQLALQKLRWPCRFEKLRETPPVFVDVGHTPQAMQQLALTARKAITGPILLVFGLSEGRTPAPMLAPWLPLASEVFLTEAQHRSLDVELMSKSLAQTAPECTKNVFKNMEEALETALEKAEREGKTIIITGSLFLAMEARAYLQGVSPGRLRFF